MMMRRVQGEMLIEVMQANGAFWRELGRVDLRGPWLGELVLVEEPLLIGLSGG